MRKRMRDSELHLALVTTMWMAAPLIQIAGPRRQQLQLLPSSSKSSKSSTVLSETLVVPVHHLPSKKRRKRRKTETDLRVDHLLGERGRKAQRKRNTDQNQRRESTGLQVLKANTNLRRRIGRGLLVSLHLRKAVEIDLPPLMALLHLMLPVAGQAVLLLRNSPS